MRAVAMVCVLAGLAGCAQAPTASDPTAPPASPAPPAPEGTALANCERQLRIRGAWVTQIIRVDIFEDQRGIITAAGTFGTSFTCFTNRRGEVVNITVDRRSWI